MRPAPLASNAPPRDWAGYLSFLKKSAFFCV